MNKTQIIKIGGMTCQGCVKSIHDTAGKLEGVITMSVDLEDEMATVTFDTDKINISDITDAIEDAGFDAELPKN